MNAPKTSEDLATKILRLPAPDQERVMALIDEALEEGDPGDEAAPTWLNLDAVISPEVRAEMHGLADEVESMTASIEGLAERCLRALVAAERRSHLLDDAGDGYEAFRRWSGTGELFDALYALRNTVDAARMERPDGDPPGEWWARVRSDLGVTEWGVSER